MSTGETALTILAILYMLFYFLVLRAVVKNNTETPYIIGECVVPLPLTIIAFAAFAWLSAVLTNNIF